MSKKSQMEIVGMVVIVLIISIALLFFLSVSIRGKNNETPQGFSMSQLATNTITTLLKTTVDKDTCDYTVQTIIEKCAEGEDVDCSARTEYITMDSCEIADDFIDKIFLKTLDTWQKRYYFYVEVSESELFNVPSDAEPDYCKIGGNFKKMESKTFPIPTNSGNVIVTLQICE